MAFDFVDKNLEKVNKLEGSNFNIFFEQVLLYEMALSSNKSIGCFIHENIGDNQYHNFANFDDVPDKRNYLHLLGFYKKQLQVCKKMESFVIKNYPEYYQRLEKLFSLPTVLESSGFKYTKQESSMLEYEYMKELIFGNKLSCGKNSVLMRDLISLGKSKVLHQLLSTSTEFFILPTTDFHCQSDKIILTIAVR